MHRQKTTKPFTLANLDYLNKQRRLKLDPRYQREAVWTRSQKQLLIDSLLQDIDIPKLYFRATSAGDYQYEVVDGQQRLRAVFDFFADEFPLPDDSDAVDQRATASKRMSELHTDLQMKLRDTQLDICVLQSGYEDDDIEEIFLRLQNGTPLNAAEKRRALPGGMREVVEELATHDVFKGMCAFSGKRYAYEDAVAKILHLVLNGSITDIKHSSLKRTYEQYVNIGMSHADVVRVKAALNFVVKSFKNTPSPRFKKFSAVSVVYLVSEMRETYSLAAHPKEFADAYLAFEQRRIMNEELEEEDQDARLAAYTSAARADRVQDLEFRHETLRRELIAAIPDLERKDEQRLFSQDQRLAIFLRDGGACATCGQKCKEAAFHADHIKPFSRGGRTTIANGQVLCPSCNAKKGGTA